MIKDKIIQLNTAKEYAKLKGGECLSTEYINCDSKLEWRCSNNEHDVWMASYGNTVNKNHWCPECAKTRLSNQFKLNDAIKRAKDYAKSKGGQCLSTQYVNARKKLKWKCIKGHDWEAMYFSVVNNGSWCRECSNEQVGDKLKIKDALLKAKDYAVSRGGECLSTEYINAQKNLTWKCSNKNHNSWEATYTNMVIRNHWCPECGKRNLSEKRTRLIFERFFGKLFPSVKPTWNINPWTNKLLELDGYCQEFNVAFEYDGEHHFETTRGKKKKDLTYQQFKDYQKQKNCIKQGVLLINIPYIKEQCRAKFQPFLENVVLACKGMGLEMVFSPDQLVDLERDFYLI